MTEANNILHYNFDLIRKHHGGHFPECGHRLIFENGESLLVTSTPETSLNVVKVHCMIGDKEYFMPIGDLLSLSRIEKIKDEF